MYDKNKRREYERKYRKTEKYKEYSRKYVAKYKETKAFKESQKKYKQRHKEKIREKSRVYEREYKRKRLLSDIQFRLRFVLRSRLSKAIKEKQKAGSFVKDLGCSISELIEYLESKFQSGMSWSNKGKWHIDHIIPLCSFDLTDRSQFLRACHYTNLQPLWASDNMKKGTKLL